VRDVSGAGAYRSGQCGRPHRRPQVEGGFALRQRIQHQDGPEAVLGQEELATAVQGASRFNKAANGEERTRLRLR